VGVGDGGGGDLLQLAAEAALLVVGPHVGEEHLAAGGGAARVLPAYPVLTDHRRGAADLVDVAHHVPAGDGDVHGLPQVGGEVLADPAALLGEVEAGGHG